MKHLYRVLLNAILVLAVLFAPLTELTQPALALGTGCASSQPAGTYTATVCFTSPADGSTLSGDTTITATISVNSLLPGTQRMVFYLDGAYLLTDYETPYTFTLPTTKWIDGSHTLAVEALMRDTLTTQRASVSVIFNNGITTPPVNTNQFVPTSGRPAAAGTPFIVAAGGDGASGELNATNVSNLVTSLNPNLFLYLGDVYEKGGAAEFYNWYGTPTTNFGRLRSITDPTVGNHEYTTGTAAGYFDYWNNIPNYYSFNAGGWHFISLNSNSAAQPTDPLSTQYKWLQKNLASNTKACTIVYYHHPLFNIGPEGPTTTMTDIWKLMAQYGVDMVINGHDHDYQRWMPLDANGQPNSSGITEFVVGSSGHGLQTFTSTDSRVAYSNDTNPTAFGVLLLQLNKSGANFKYVNTNGSVLDSGVVPCVPAAADTLAPTLPTGLSAVAANASQVDLNWSASSDATGVAGYSIYRNGTSVATVTGAYLTYSDKTALPQTIYNYSIDAFDAAGNHSAKTAAVTVTTPIMPASLTFPVLADTYVSSAATPISKFGAAPLIRADYSPDLHSYLRFAVQGLAGKPIVQARLLLYANNNGVQGINAQAVSDNTWDEVTMTYANAPALGSTIASSGPFSAGNWVTLDVTPYITGEGIYSFGISTTGLTTLSFPSRESGLNSAQLILDFQPKGPDSQAPTVPTGLSATASGPTQVNLNWTAATDNIAVAGYTIYRNGAVLTTVPGANVSYSDTSVGALTTNNYSIDAFDQAGNHSAASNSVSATTPLMPTSLTLKPDADSYVNGAALTTNYGLKTALRVDASPDTRSYLRFTVPGLAGSSIARARLLIYPKNNASQGINALGITDNTWGEKTINYNNAPLIGNLLASSGKALGGSQVTLDVTPYITGQGMYSFAITTPSSTATSLGSRESGVTSPQLILDLQFNSSDNQAPTIPTGLSAVSAGPGQLDLSWTAASDNVAVAGYTIYRDGSVLATIPATSLTYSDTTAASATTYHYAIDAFDQAGNHSAASAAVPVTSSDPPPTVPTGLTAIIINSNQVDLSWAASTDNVAVGGYTIYRDGSILASVPATSLTYSDTTTVPGNTYNYSLDAFDEFGNHSAVSAPVPASPPDTQAPTTPGGVSAVASGPAQVDLSWTASTDNVAVTGYTVYRNGIAIATISGTALTYSDKLALPNTTFNYSVDAFDKSGNHSIASAPPVQVTTPAMPASLTFTPEADTYVNAGSPTANFGVSTFLRADSTPDIHSYLRFNVQLLGGTPILRARLLLFANTTGTQGINALNVSDNSWGELTTNSTNAPALGNTLATSGAFTAGNWVTLDVTPYITGEGAYSFGITTPGTAALSFASRETGANAPQLILDLQNNGPDIIAPTTPIGLTAAPSSPTQVDLSWPASTDNVGVSGYTVYRDGTSLATVSGTSLTYSDKTAIPNAIYAYSVDAFDRAGNHSTATDPVSVTMPGMPASLTITPDADTYVNAGSPTSNFGHSTALRASSSPDLHSYLRFTIQGLGGTPITRARLLVYANSNGSQGVNANAVTDNTWGEMSMNYGNAPILGNILASSGAFTTGNWVSLDVTAYITGEGTYSFGLSTTGASALSFSALEAGTNAPQLVLDLQNGGPDTQAPSTPSGLTATASGPLQVDLNWTAASDNIGVSGYTIYRDGLSVATVSGTTLTYSDKTALPLTTYNYSIDAFDQAGNHSSASAEIPATTPKMSASLNFAPDADTYVNAGSPTSNFGHSTALRASSSPDLHSYLRFTVQGLGGTPITRARLLVYANSNGVQGVNANAVADNTWSEMNMNYGNAPALGNILASSGAFTTGNWVSLDVTAYITGEGTYNFGLSTTGASALSFPALEAGTNAPQLVLDLQNGDVDTQAPTIPAGLSATASGPTQVDLSWTASSDNIGVSGYTIYRDSVSIATVSGSTLTYSDKTALPLSTYNYSVDAFDQAGNHSSATGLVPAATPKMTATLTFTPDADTYVNAGLPTNNFGVSTSLRAANSPEADSYLRFTVQGLGGTPITRARLLVYANSNGSQGVSARSVADNTWGELTANFSNAPALGIILTTSAPFTTGTWVALDVTPSISAEGTYSFSLSTSGASSLSFASRETGATAPQLVLDLQNGDPDTQAPTVPTGLTATAAGSNQVNLSWAAASDNFGVSGYTVYRDGAVLATLSGASLTYSDTTTLAGHTYSYSLDAFDQAGNHSTATAPVAVAAPDTQAPSVPGGLTATVFSTTRINLSWTASTDDVGVNGYTIYRDGVPLATVIGTTLAYSDKTVLPANTYNYTVDAFDKAGNHSAATGPVAATTADPAPTVPTGLAATAASSTQVDLSWTASTDNLAVAGYTLYRDGAVLTSVSGSSLTYSDTTVLPGKTYSYSVDAFDQPGSHSAASTPVSVSTPDTLAPTTPSGLTASASSATQVDLSWTASTDNVAVTGYSIYRGGTLLTTVPGASLTYSDKTALPKTTYNYTVDAFDQTGNHSIATAPVSATTPNLPASLTFAPDADTYVNAGSPATNFGHSTALRASLSPDLHSYLRFTVQGLGGTPVTRARLLLYANSNGSQGVSALAVTDNTWGEMSMNYGNAPALGSILTTSAPFTTGNWVTLDVTAYVTGEGTYNFGLGTSGASALSFSSREAGTNLPQLVLDLQNGDSDTQAPSVPDGLTALASSSTQVDLSWAAASDNIGVTGYTIYRDGTALTTVSGTSLTYSDTSALSGHNYNYAVDAFDQAGNHSAASALVAVTTADTQAPTVPGGLTASVISATRVNLSWTASTDNVAVIGYTIYRDGVALATVVGTTLAYSDKSAAPATSYNYTVDAYDKAGNHSAATNPVPATTPDPAPTVPGGLTAVASSPTQVDLSWTASTDNLAVAGYTIYRGGTVLATVPGSSLSYSDTTVQSGISYSYSVDAFDQPGSHSAASAPVSVTLPDTIAPTTPAGLTATASTPTKIVLSWTAATDNIAVTGYTIYRDGSVLGSVSGSVLTYSDTTAVPASTYNYSIDAFDQAGNHSPATAPVPATTPNIPSSLTFSPLADTYVNAGSASSNFGKATALRVSSTPDLHGYLRFVVQGLGGKTIVHARLLLFANSNGSQGINALAVADNTWGELTTIYSNAPALGSLLVTSAPFTTGNWVTLDVTAYLTGEGTYSFGITTSGTSAINLSSRESGANAPQLILDLQ